MAHRNVAAAGLIHIRAHWNSYYRARSRGFPRGRRPSYKYNRTQCPPSTYFHFILERLQTACTGCARSRGKNDEKATRRCFGKKRAENLGIIFLSFWRGTDDSEVELLANNKY